MTFEEFLPRLERDLRSMSARHRLAFSAACRERAVVNFEIYARDVRSLDSSAQALDEVWQYIAAEKHVLDVAILRAACEQQFSQPSENHPLASAATDTIQMLDLLLNQATDPRAEISCQIAGWAEASIDYYLQVDPSSIRDLKASCNCVLWGSTGIFVDGVSIPDAATFQQDAIARAGRGTRLPESTNPVIVLKNGEPVLASSTIGFALQEVTLQNLINVLDLGMDPQVAVNRPDFQGPFHGISLTKEVLDRGFRPSVAYSKRIRVPSPALSRR